MKNFSLFALCAFLIAFTSCEKNKEEKAFALKFAEAINQKDTVRIDSMMGTKGVFAWSETQIAAVNLDDLKIEESGENQFKVTLGSKQSFSIATAAGDEKSFHVLQPKGFFSVDTMLVNALSKRGEIADGDDDAAIANKVKAVKEKATKMDGRIYVGNAGLNFYFLKKGDYGYEPQLYQRNLLTDKTEKINVAAKVEDQGIGFISSCEDYALVGSKLVFVAQNGMQMMSAFYIDLNTLKVKSITDDYNLAFSKDKKSLVVTTITEMSDMPMSYGDFKTKTSTMKLDNLK